MRPFVPAPRVPSPVQDKWQRADVPALSLSCAYSASTALCSRYWGGALSRRYDPVTRSVGYPEGGVRGQRRWRGSFPVPVLRMIYEVSLSVVKLLKHEFNTHQSLT